MKTERKLVDVFEDQWEQYDCLWLFYIYLLHSYTYTYNVVRNIFSHLKCNGLNIWNIWISHRYFLSDHRNTVAPCIILLFFLCVAVCLTIFLNCSKVSTINFQIQTLHEIQNTFYKFKMHTEQFHLKWIWLDIWDIWALLSFRMTLNNKWINII